MATDAELVGEHFHVRTAVRAPIYCSPKVPHILSWTFHFHHTRSQFPQERINLDYKV